MPATSKKAIMKAKIENAIVELMVKSSVENIYLPDGTTTLASKLADIVSSINTINGEIAELPTSSDVSTAISNAIDALIDGAPSTYDTLKEISDYIATHQSEYEAIVAAIAGKVDKVEGKGLSTEDYTTAEKTKLAGIAEGANAYTLPTATASVLGGVKIGANIAVANDGTISGDYSAATTSAAGLMSSTDKAKLDGIAEGATATTVDSALSATSENPVQNKVVKSALDGKVDTVSGKGLSTEDYTTAEKTKLAGIAEGATATTVDSALSATSENPVQNKVVKSALDSKVDTVSGKGLSTNDYTDAEKTKLAGIAEGANAYTLPAATTTTLGGVIVGTNLSVDANGTISGNYSAATTSANGLMSSTDKAKLDGLNNIVVSETQPSSMNNGDVWLQIIPDTDSNESSGS